MIINCQKQVGTELYMSPEQLDRYPYDHKVDIYALGMILYELLVPFQTEMERIETLEEIRNLEWQKNFPEMTMVKSMLSHSPNQRPEVSDILRKMAEELQPKSQQLKKETKSI